jgi:hypothetical protein
MPFCTLQEAWGTDFEQFANPSPAAEAVAEVEAEAELEAEVEAVAAPVEVATELVTMQPAYDNMRTDMDLMNKKIDSLIRRLERQPAPQDFFNKNIHDIILFVIFGLFLILVLDGMYKILLLKLTGFK